MIFTVTWTYPRTKVEGKYSGIGTAREAWRAVEQLRRDRMANVAVMATNDLKQSWRLTDEELEKLAAAE